MLFKNAEFKKLSIIAFLGGLFVVGGFYLTMLPIIVQIILLFIGVVCAVAAVVGLLKFLFKMNKDAV